MSNFVMVKGQWYHINQYFEQSQSDYNRCVFCGYDIMSHNNGRCPVSEIVVQE